jgi:hypothetical protein
MGNRKGGERRSLSSPSIAMSRDTGPDDWIVVPNRRVKRPSPQIGFGRNEDADCREAAANDTASPHTDE